MNLEDEIRVIRETITDMAGRLIRVETLLELRRWKRPEAIALGALLVAVASIVLGVTGVV